MSIYLCDAGHRTERLTACTGWRHRVLHIHELPGGKGWEACLCGKVADEEIVCPETTGKAAPDALILPAMCGRAARIVRCIACGREASQDYCDACWSDLQGGYQE